MSSSLWSSRPCIALWSVGFWAVNISHLLFLSLRNTISPLRSVPQWSYRLSMGTAFMRAVYRYLSAVRFQQPLKKVPGKSGDRFVLIEPPKDTAPLRGVLDPLSAAAKPAPVSAVWYPSHVMAPSDNPSRRRKVVLYAAGGGFVTGFDPALVAKIVLPIITSDHFGATHVFNVQYRLASDVDPFPGALFDFFAAYQYVLDLGVAAADIVLMGDSAGGNLVLALLRYLVDHRLPQPGAAAIFSPWVEVTRQAVEKIDNSHIARYDVLDAPVIYWGVEAYRPKGRPVTQEEESYISPLGHPFRLETPLYIEAGALEGLFESISIFAGQMADVKGNRVQFHSFEDMPHDFFALWPAIGTKKEAGEALERARTFFEE
ncbi:hypothetical protein PG987_007858 [Apiospora arundinis]